MKNFSKVQQGSCSFFVVIPKIVIDTLDWKKGTLIKVVANTEDKTVLVKRVDE